MRFLVAIVLLLAALPAAEAQNAALGAQPAVRPALLATPRVTIKAENAPLSDVLAELEKQTGARIWHPFRNEPDQPLVTMEAQDQPVRQVLRDIAAQVGCYLGAGRRDYYQLVEGEDPRAGAPTATTGPYTLHLRSINVRDSMTLDFVRTDQQPMRFDRGMTLNIEIEADEDVDLARVEGFDPAARATDDRGRAVPAAAAALPDTYERPYRPDYGLIPSLPLNMQRPERDATALASLEGDLLVHPEARVVQLALDLDEPQATATDAGYALGLAEAVTEGDGTYRVKANMVLPPEAAGGEMVLVPGMTRAFPRLPRLPEGEVRLEAPDGTPLVSRSGGASVRSTRLRQDEPFTHEYEWRFDLPANQTPARLVYEFVATLGEVQALPFRFENVPLPTWGQ